MLTLKEYIELKTKLINGDIGIEAIKLKLWSNFKKGERSWHTIDWKERRQVFLGDKCEICHSKDTLTVQHLSHPKEFKNCLNEITSKFSKEHKDEIQVKSKSELINYVLTKYEYSPIQLCPNCKSRKPNKRLRNNPPFLCTKCSFEFEKPVFNSVEELISIFFESEDSIEARDKCFISKDKWQNHHNLNTIKYWMGRELLNKTFKPVIEKEALLLYLEGQVKYLSFEDSITACKKCASYFDLYDLELCPQCKKNYKGLEYKTCIPCLPDDKRKMAMQKVAFGKQWHEMEKGLGID
jgi:hypothetical protein